MSFSRCLHPQTAISYLRFPTEQGDSNESCKMITRLLAKGISDATLGYAWRTKVRRAHPGLLTVTALRFNLVCVRKL
jgi:hypothetical protein